MFSSSLSDCLVVLLDVLWSKSPFMLVQVGTLDIPRNPSFQKIEFNFLI